MTKIAVVCGASSGIGMSITTKLLDEGFFVYGISRRKPEIYSDRFLFYQSDFYHISSIETTCKAILESSNGNINVVINCVGDILTETYIKDLAFEQLQETFQINFFSSFLISKYFFDAISSSSGCFVFISSVAKDKVYPMIADYCAAKAALSNFVKSLATELAPYRSRAVAVSPAVVNTDLFNKSKYTIEEAAKWHKLGRVGEPQDISEIILFLISDSASWITGTDYIIDGGMLL